MESRRRTKKQLESELKERGEEILRLKAEFENYRKHLDREREAFIKVANEQLIRQLLEVLDNFERALPLIKDEKAIEGITMIHKQFKKVLEDAGLRRIESLGRRFDPYYHEVLLQEESKEEDDIIVEELQPGYMLKDKVIRHAKVKIAKNMKGD
ncbi:MAG: nucleotide exchange factor GrpE [Candidatus Altiarchaeota archaeon]|nr:nucleotide exchange factor GrpE [Candidatus Altiarchaeota archaeon]